MYMMYAIIFFALTLQSIETPKYKLLQKYEDFEIRDYGTLIINQSYPFFMNNIILLIHSN